MEPITIKTRLDSNVIRLENVETLLGKEVEITIREINERPRRSLPAKQSLGSN